MRFGSIHPLWGKFWKQPRSRRALLLEAVFWLAAARLAIFFLPFPKIAHYLGEPRPPLDTASKPYRNPALAQEISWAIDRAARLFPFRLVCLPRALAGWKMLHRRQIQGLLHFGASRNTAGGPLRTHAWLDACGVEVSGYPEAHDCVEIGHFTC